MSAGNVQLTTANLSHGSFRGLVLGALVFASGLCGISYEILFGRILGNLVGDQFTVSASVLLTFMLGIGIGTRLAHRFWRWLWALEIGIGLCGIGIASATPWIEWLLYTSPNTNGMMLGCIIVLLFPSLLIGATLPLFAGYLQAVTSGAGFNRTYALYNFGAALTAMIIEFWLLRQFGIKYATFIISSINLLVGISLLIAYRHLCQPEPLAVNTGTPTPAKNKKAGEKQKAALRSITESGYRRNILALILASIASAVFQLTMIKIMECLLGPFRETFALVLTTVLLGIALGSALVKRLNLSFASLMWANLAALGWLLICVPTVMQLYANWYYDATATQCGILTLKLAVTCVFMLVPAICFGATIPALLLGMKHHVSRDSGRLLFWSSLANAAGFLLMAFVLHRHLDYGMLIVVTGLLCAAALAIYTPRRRWIQVLSPLLLLVLLRGVWDEKLLYIAYDSFQSPEFLKATRSAVNIDQRYKSRNDVFSLTRYQDQTYFFINGFVSIPLNAPSEKVAGAFPAVFAPRADRALVLGVGSGATTATVGELFAHTDAVEINEAVLEHLDLMREFNFNLPDNDRVKLHLDDGIHYVKATRDDPQKYSLIINTVTSPRFFSSAKLYTMDFLAAAKQRLTPDGVYATYFDTRVGEEGADIMLRTLGASFKHCAMGAIKAGYFFILCSDQPIKAHQPRLVAEHPLLGPTFLNQFHLKPDVLPYGLILMDATKAIGNRYAPINTMNRPVLEFAMARLRDRGYPAFLARVANAIRVAPVQDALKDNMKFDPHQILFHMDNLLGGNPEITQGWRRALYQEKGFKETHLRRERAVVARAAAQQNAAQIFFHYANKLKDRGDYDEAIAEYQQVLALAPDFDNANFNMAAVYELKGQFDEAISHYKQEQEVDTDEDESDFRIARLLIRLQRYAEAIPYLERSVEQMPDSPEIAALLQLARSKAPASAENTPKSAPPNN